MKRLELTVIGAITATMLTSPAFAKALHRNFETAPSPNSPMTSGGGNLGCNEVQTKFGRCSDSGSASRWRHAVS